MVLVSLITEYNDLFFWRLMLFGYYLWYQNYYYKYNHYHHNRGLARSSYKKELSAWKMGEIFSRTSGKTIILGDRALIENKFYKGIVIDTLEHGRDDFIYGEESRELSGPTPNSSLSLLKQIDDF